MLLEAMDLYAQADYFKSYCMFKVLSEKYPDAAQVEHMYFMSCTLCARIES